MLWYLATSTLILATALALAKGRWRRRELEAAAILVAVLPVLPWLLERTGVQPLSLQGTGAAGTPAWHTAMVWVWLAGVAAGLARLGWQALGVLRLVRRASVLPEPAAVQAGCVLGIGMDRVQRHFRLSSRAGTPMVLPTVPAMVVLPADWPSWSARLQASALRHEWHHVRQGDAFWQGLLHVFCIALWFHPLAWRLAECWRDECERGADGAAVGAGDPADYATDLLALITSAPCPPAGMAVALGFTGSGSGRLQRRLEALFRETSGGLPLGTFLLLTFLALGCAWTGIRQATKTELRVEAQLRLSAAAFPADGPEVGP